MVEKTKKKNESGLFSIGSIIYAIKADRDNNEVKMHLYKNDNYYLFAKLDSREKEELYITKESNQFTYEILGEKSLKLDNKEILNLPNSASDNVNELYFCIFSRVSISYTMTTYF